MADPTLPRFNSREQMAVVPFFFMHEGEECVKVQIAGETRFAPVYRAQDMWERDGLQEITYAERWPEQYRQFKEGSAQIADGTSLEEAPFLNPSRIGELRALKIYSIESLANLDDRNIPRLGGKGYELKEMAQQYLHKRQQTGAESKFAQMQAQIEALQAALANTVPSTAGTRVDKAEWEKEADRKEAEIDAMLQRQAADREAAAEGEYTRLKEDIKAKTGSYPRGNPSIETLRRIVSELDGE